MKTIKYQGREYEVPDWAKFIATDSDGDIYVFELMPVPMDDDGVGFWGKPSNMGRLKRVSRNGWSWRNTLEELEEGEQS